MNRLAKSASLTTFWLTTACVTPIGSADGEWVLHRALWISHGYVFEFETPHSGEPHGDPKFRVRCEELTFCVPLDRVPAEVVDGTPRWRARVHEQDLATFESTAPVYGSLDNVGDAPTSEILLFSRCPAPRTGRAFGDACEQPDRRSLGRQVRQRPQN